MATKLEKVLLIGSTGTIGYHILHAFLPKVASFKRVAIFTSQNTVGTKKELVDKVKASGVEVIVGDLGNEAQVKETFSGFDTIVSALGRGALHLQSNLISIAASLTPPKRFFPSEYGTDIRYSPVTSPSEIPHQNKLKVRAHIEALAREGKITYTYVVTGPFADTFFISRMPRIGLNMGNGTYGIVGPEDAEKQEKISGTTYSDTARYVLSAVQAPPETTKNATLRVSSFTAKPAELLKGFESVLGKKLNTIYTPLDELRKLEKEKWAEKDPYATVYTLNRIWYEGGSDFSRKPVALYLDEKTGEDVEDEERSKHLFEDVPKRSLEEVIKEIVM
ncbi:NADP-binding protein [Dacryopinax primogenitus]|uniref:NADP-binding protein n=1 Tax=Dacryopinax primogenitus (strain DJM 731) TaxID=1858805 RepID=M5G7G8_DACPD|nr:NADP-binding protein [Dacryopinax primogenitus]EJU04125.1 NADP-binding protein [Dacryopinax primogenitus]